MTRSAYVTRDGVKAKYWTPEEDERLRALWAEGHSASEIGRAMGRPKNGIIGRSHRLRLPPRPSPIVSAKPCDPSAPKRPKRVRIDSAAALARAQANSIGRAKAFRRHAAEGGKGLPLALAAHPIPAAAGDPRPAVPGGTADRPCDRGSSSHETAPRLDGSPPAAAAFSGGEGCRFPLWGDHERPSHAYCGAPRRLRLDGRRCAYCAEHAARAFTVTGAVADEQRQRFALRSSRGGWVAA